MHWYFQQNQCLTIKKQPMHSIHTLAWGPYAHGVRVQLPIVPMRLDGAGCIVLPTKEASYFILHITM